ncbi:MULTISPECIES: hypothetical protein [Shewanella]|uniref:hypothetical protein n=1 Tax=Shewanella TaxID=22 RepID=UPI0004913529|nr:MULTISPECIES: hypothetical protein [Shewanella]QLE85478.1 hypothetical protein FLM48_10560 [Shewanella sp. Scap07]
MKKRKIFQMILATLSILGWSLAIYALLLFDQARPDRAIGYYLSKGASIRLAWDPDYTVLLQDVIWTCAGISLLSLAFNFYFATHSKMGYWFNIPLLLLTSVTAGLYLSFFI